MQFAAASAPARVFNKPPAPRLRGLGFATRSSGGGGFASPAPTVASAKAAGTYAVMNTPGGNPAYSYDTATGRTVGTSFRVPERAPAPAPAPAGPSAVSNVAVTVSPNVQTQVSPQISPNFVQQFQPSGSPVGASTAQGGSPLTGPAQGVSAADVQKMMQAQAESQAGLVRQLQEQQAAQAAQAAAEAKARQERADAERALSAAQNQALIETLTKAGAAAAPAPAPSGPQMVSAPAGGGGPVSPPISIPEAAGPATTAVSVHSGAANMLPIALAVLAVGALVLYSRKGKRR